MKQLPPNLRTNLRELGERVNDRFPHINHGGCCVFAASVAKRLARYGIPVEVIVTHSGDSESIEYKREILNNCNKDVNKKANWEGVGLSFWHVGVRFKLNNVWYTYDTDKLRRAKHIFGNHKLNAHPGALTIKEAAKLAAEAKGWNTMFDRSDIRNVNALIDQYI